MTPGSIRLGTYAGIPVRAHWSMGIIAVWFGVLLSADLGVVGGVVAHGRVLRLDPGPRVRPRPGGSPLRRAHPVDRSLGARRCRPTRS